MQVDRVGGQYRGSLVRPEDEMCVGFQGVVELVAALDRLEDHRPEDHRPEPPADRDGTEGEHS
jgi:hypothetical protein